MMNQTAERMWGGGLSLLSPSHLIDRLLDHIEKLSAAILPAQADNLSCIQVGVEVHPDEIDA